VAGLSKYPYSKHYNARSSWESEHWCLRSCPCTVLVLVLATFVRLRARLLVRLWRVRVSLPATSDKADPFEKSSVVVLGASL